MTARTFSIQTFGTGVPWRMDYYLHWDNLLQRLFFPIRVEQVQITTVNTFTNACLNASHIPGTLLKSMSYAILNRIIE